jgi:hypothetical protein
MYFTQQGLTIPMARSKIPTENTIGNPDDCTFIAYVCDSLAILWKDWARQMEANALAGQDHFSLRGTCPHGRPHESVFVMVTTPHIESLSGGAVHRLCAVLQCQGCLNHILGIVTRAHNQPTKYTYVIHFPLGEPDDTVAKEIPDHIKLDFSEALRCRWVKAYNATAEMCRRALEASSIHLGADPKLNIRDQIDYLASIGLITEPLRKMAHKVRLGGNRGAHPPEDPEFAKPFTEQDADAVIKFTTEYFHHVYVMPALLDDTDFSKRSTEAKPAS